MNATVGWLDASSGASGDMFLGALVGAGVPLGAIRTAVDAVAPEPVTLHVTEVARNGFVATRVEVTVADVAMHRTWTRSSRHPSNSTTRQVMPRETLSLVNDNARPPRSSARKPVF